MGTQFAHGFDSQDTIRFDSLYVTQSDKDGLIAYFKVSRNAGFKYPVCCSSPMVEAKCTKFSHDLYQFLTFKSIYSRSSQHLSFLPF